MKLHRLSITCDNSVYGCTLVVKLDSLSSHLKDCEFNPKRPISCEQGCGMIIPKDELQDHNCIKELRSIIQSQQINFNTYQQQISELKFIMNEYKREVTLLKVLAIIVKAFSTSNVIHVYFWYNQDFMTAMRISNPTMRAIADQMERDEVVRWSGTLASARVTRWGGMISTPDENLQVNLESTRQ